MKQSKIFLKDEGSAWFERNKDKLPVDNDAVLETLKTTNIEPVSVLEVGCSNGWRLDLLKKHYNCNIWGVDPASMPVSDHIFKRTADDLKIFSRSAFDMIIYG